MTVQLTNETIVLSGACGIQDADALLRLALDYPRAAIDWRGCTSAHLAVVQIMLASHARLIGPPSSPFLRDVVGPAIRAGDLT